jgi:hypothetical protein
VDHVRRVLVLHVQADLVRKVLALHVQVDHAQLVVQASAHLVQVDSALQAQLRVAVQDPLAALAAALEPLVRSVRVDLRARLESQSAPREKSLSKDRPRALVVQ